MSLQSASETNPIDPPPGSLVMRVVALPRDTNGFGDISGGWLVGQMDMAGSIAASKIARGRLNTVAIDAMSFMVPVLVGAQLSFYASVVEVGRSSIRMLVETWLEDIANNQLKKVTEAMFVFVAIDDEGRTRKVGQT